MRQPTELFNLDVGPTIGNVIRPQLEAVKIGPFSIRFADDYEQRRRLLSQPGQFVSNLRGTGRVLEVEEYTLPARPASGWICTAAVAHDGTAGVRSLLAESPIDDSGLWDL